jgi:hypothetical protein
MLASRSTMQQERSREEIESERDEERIRQIVPYPSLHLCSSFSTKSKISAWEESIAWHIYD